MDGQILNAPMHVQYNARVALLKVKKQRNQVSLKPPSLVFCIIVNKCGLQEQICEVLHTTIFYILFIIFDIADRSMGLF